MLHKDNNRPDILSKKEWKEICQSKNGQDIRIIGTTNLKKGDKDKDNGLYINGGYYKKVHKTKLHRIVGYVDAGGSGDYVRFVKLNPFILLFWFFILAIICFMLWMHSENKIKPISEILELEKTRAIAETASNSIDYVSVPGFSDKIDISDEVSYVALKNPEANQYYLYYEITENGKSVCKTKLIEPGQQYDFNAAGKMKKGNHTVQIATYAATWEGYTTGEPVATQTVTINIL